MQQTRRIPITELNDHLTCKLCKGYFIDATTIIECLHTFCRSCIVRYLQKNKYCPVCDVQVHKTKPLLNIRPDKTLQDIVYKLVPSLFQNEMCRRRKFYAAHPEARPSNLEQCGEASYQHILSPDETICLSLTYHGGTGAPRYLRCPAGVSVVHLQKLLRAKYDLSQYHRVDILHNQDCLNSHLTLMDIAYIYLWRRKGPLELTYRIYENRAKRLKLEEGSSDALGNLEGGATESESQNEWKEVQLRISENGEMCVTGMEDALLFDESVTNCVIKNEAQGDNDALEASAKGGVAVQVAKRDVPALKYIGKGVNGTTPVGINGDDSSSCATSTNVVTKANNKNGALPMETNPRSTSSTTVVTPITTSTQSLSTTSTGNCTTSTTNCGKNSNLATSTANSSTPTTNCVTNSNSIISAANTSVFNSLISTTTKTTSAFISTLPATTTVVSTTNPKQHTNVTETKPMKHKLERDNESEPTAKQPKQTILNHCLGIQNLSNNHPLKRHSQSARHMVEPVDGVEVKVPTVTSGSCSTSSTITNAGFPKPIVSKTFNNLQCSRPGTPNPTAQKWPMGLPCYAPKPSYNPVINVPKIQPGTSVLKPEVRVSVPQPTPQANLNNKLTIKNKPNTPIGYKTLRDPPKTWNPQISRASLLKSGTDQKYADLKNIRPAKFFKMRNNMPRYLGNPASGVKPLYQIQSSPEKDKNVDIKPDKSEIKRHSVVKIDPKTLKPVCEKAPEATSLRHQSSDMKINTSSVPIFNPLKLQSSPKNERRSPKSPHSPKAKSTSPSNKREKVNLNFTPPNPFIPNLTSPTVSPNQFLYPSGPPGFPTYDPRVMAAYHSLLYGQRMPYPPSPLPGLSLDLNPRKNYDLITPTSPKIPPMQHSPKLHNNMPQSPKESNPAPSSPKISNNVQKQTLLNLQKKSVQKNQNTKKSNHKDSMKNEKSLQNAVEKLTQNKVKEMQAEHNSNSCKSPKVESAPTIKDIFSEELMKNGSEPSESKKEVEEPKARENDNKKTGDVNCVPVKTNPQKVEPAEEKKTIENNLSNNNTDTLSLVTTDGK